MHPCRPQARVLRSREGDTDAPVQLTLLFHLADNDAANLAGAAHVRATAGLQIDRAIFADHNEAHLAAAHGWLYGHGAHKAWVGLELGVADPALRYRMVGRDKLVQAAGQGILVNGGGILDVEIES